MFRFTLLLACVLAVSANGAAQARRIPRPRAATPATAESATKKDLPAAPATIDGQTAEALYDDANGFAKRKFDEFAARKIPYSDSLRETTLREGRQLAARYAALLETKQLSGDDYFYLGKLHILASNDDGAAAAFKNYLAVREPVAEHAQTARAFVVVTAARRKDFAVAESAFTDFLRNTPLLLRERILIENELAKNYFVEKNYAQAAAHADAAVVAGQPAIKDSFVEPRLLELFTAAGETLFDVYAANNETAKACAALETLRNAGIAVQSAGLYNDATGKLIPYLIEIKRKPDALALVKQTQDALNVNFRDPAARARINYFLKTHEKQYRLLGESAPELVVDKWIVDKDADETAPNSLASRRGRVVLIDFWATWCKPCFASFPKLTELHETYHAKGLDIIGLTRYYGSANGLPADEPGEFGFLQKFRRNESLPYTFAVAKNESNHRSFASAGLPTTVLIDKHGIIRYIQTGYGLEDNMEKMIQKLLAEK